MNRKKILWMILFVVIAVLCIWTVVSQSKSFDPEALYSSLKNAKKGYLATAAIGMTGFIFFEGIGLKIILNGMLRKQPDYADKPAPMKGTGFIYAAADLYFSAITPSASGGQPAAFYFLIKDGYPAGLASAALLLNMSLYTAALFTIGILCLVLKPGIFLLFPLLAKIMILGGYMVLLGMTLGMVFFLWKDRIVYRFANAILHILAKLHLLKHEERKRDKLQRTMVLYRHCAQAIAGQPMVIAKAFFYNLLQRFFQISVTLSCFLAIGGSWDSWKEILSIQGMTAVGSNCVPIPGSMGAVDYILIEGLSRISEVRYAANLALLSRGFAFYGCTLLCAVVVLAGYLRRHTFFIALKSKIRYHKERT